jgi:hypothetical protein
LASSVETVSWHLQVEGKSLVFALGVPETGLAPAEELKRRGVI